MRVLKPGEPIPAGAVRVHWPGTSVQTAMAPRGSLEKESLGECVLERLESAFENWTDPRYGDCVGECEAVEALIKGARVETEAAIRRFLEGRGLLESDER